MEDATQARVVKVISPFHFLLRQEDGSTVKVEVKPTPDKHYHHLLPSIATQPLRFGLTKKERKLREEYRKGWIELDGKPITEYYTEDRPKEYLSEISANDTLRCFVSSVECLKMELVHLDSLKHLTFYFSEFKLVRIGNVHPKEMWERAHSYFQSELEG